MKGFDAFERLLPLAEAIVPHRLYAVGGSVRDALSGTPAKSPDFDVCSDLAPEKLAEGLRKCGADVTLPYGGVASATVVFDGVQCEYTAFRRDEYDIGSGSHAPTGYTFVSSPQEDALRRDFRCNAIYYDIAAKKIVDPLGGADDVRRRLLRTTREAEAVISEDPVRILRLARFCSALGFDADGEAVAACRRHIDDVDALSAERKRREWDKLMKGAYLFKGLAVAHETGLLAKLFPALAACDGLAQPPDRHAYDVLRHCFECAAAAPEKVRLAALLHDEGKAEAVARDGNMHRHAEYGTESAAQELAALGYPKNEVERVRRLIAAHMYDINCDARRIKLRRFIARNVDILDDLCALMRADSRATGKFSDSPRADRIEAEYAFLKAHGIPLSTGQLAVDGNDLAEVGLRGREIAEALSLLLDECLNGTCPNAKDDLLARAQRIALKKQKPHKRLGR